ncbi:hypothetical protein NDF60_38045, partial [Streptomyces sp. STCH 565 A]|nr:hypothetical protein [Streptomyces sp. STCH 565 A]
PHAPLPVSTQAAPAPAATASDAAPTVQRLFGSRSGSRSGAVSALASHAAAAVTSTFPGLRSSSSQQNPAEPPPPYEPPPAYSASGNGPEGGGPPPEYTAVPEGGLDPRELTEFQLDQLVHRIIGRVTRLVRTELRMDRERIGRLRDPR